MKTESKIDKYLMNENSQSSVKMKFQSVESDLKSIYGYINKEDWSSIIDYIQKMKSKLDDARRSVEKVKGFGK